MAIGVAKEFHFLLDRGPKESILGSFDVISRYFAEFDWEIPRYLSRL
jgi:hypothetical protein